MAFGESRGDYAERQQSYMTADAQRQAALIAARSPENTQRIKNEGVQYVADREHAASIADTNAQTAIAQGANENALALQKMRNSGAMDIAQLQDGTTRYIAGAQQFAAAQQAEADAIQQQLDRTHQLDVARIEADGRGAANYAPLPVYEGAGDKAKLVGYQVIDPETGEWKYMPSQAED